MKFFDKTAREFAQEAQDKGLTPKALGELFFKVETHLNTRESYWEAATYQQHMQSEDRIFYTEKDREITGFIFYRWLHPELEITHWAVKYKGCGEGGAVFSLFLSQIASKAYKVSLECGEWNKSALRLYEAYQFNKVGFRPQYYRTGEGAWILERSHSA